MEREILELKQSKGNPKLSTVSSKGQVVIPKKLRNHLSLSEGDSVLLMEIKGGIFLRKFDQMLFKKVLKDLHNQQLLSEIEKRGEKKGKTGEKNE